MRLSQIRSSWSHELVGTLQWQFWWLVGGWVWTSLKVRNSWRPLSLGFLYYSWALTLGIPLASQDVELRSIFPSGGRVPFVKYTKSIIHFKDAYSFRVKVFNRAVLYWENGISSTSFCSSLFVPPKWEKEKLWYPCEGHKDTGSIKLWDSNIKL